MLKLVVHNVSLKLLKVKIDFPIRDFYRKTKINLQFTNDDVIGNVFSTLYFLLVVVIVVVLSVT